MRTHCRNGHELTSTNIYWRGEQATCRTCNTARTYKWALKHPEEAKVSHRSRSAKWIKNNSDKVVVMHQKRRALRTQAGGSYTFEQWISLCAYYGNVCICCNREEVLTPDHIVPISLGGTSYISNIQPLCLPCNLKKHTKTTDYRTQTKLRSGAQHQKDSNYGCYL